MICVTCGDKATLTCYKCSAPTCLTHSRYYVDDANIAISNSARPECDRCSPPKFVRPFTLVRAVERGEFEVIE